MSSSMPSVVRIPWTPQMTQEPIRPGVDVRNQQVCILCRLLWCTSFCTVKKLLLLLWSLLVLIQCVEYDYEVGNRRLPQSELPFRSVCGVGTRVELWLELLWARASSSHVVCQTPFNVIITIVIFAPANFILIAAIKNKDSDKSVVSLVIHSTWFIFVDFIYFIFATLLKPKGEVTGG